MELTDREISSTAFARDVLKGLRKEQKTLPSKYFYDERGSTLFDEICAQNEYYIPRAEIGILEQYIAEIRDRITSGGKPIELVEPGSGSSLKTHVLLDHVDEIQTYIPLDISGTYLRQAADRLRDLYPELEVKPHVTDYTTSLSLSPTQLGCRRILFYPGSTIGNFHPEAALELLSSLVRMTNSRGVLIGVDTRKKRDILEAAYNDRAGVTAAFNKNLLVRLNRELYADMDPDKFRHQAFFNEEKGRVEMHLESLRDQQIHIAGETISMKRGETIHTENSYKYSPEEFRNLVDGVLKLQKMWMDEEGLFSVHYYLNEGEE